MQRLNHGTKSLREKLGYPKNKFGTGSYGASEKLEYSPEQLSRLPKEYRCAKKHCDNSVIEIWVYLDIGDGLEENSWIMIEDACSRCGKHFCSEHKIHKE